MPRFVKQIIRPGTYLAKKPTGERVQLKVTPERIKAWAARFNQMTEKGLKIPAPWRHDLSAVPTQADTGDSTRNAGFWKKLWVEDGYLTGELDAPLSGDVEKIGTTVQEVSPYILPEWEDGDGQKWDDAILHIALVTNPIVPRQSNFVEATEPTPALALSFSLDDFVGAVVMADEENVEDTKPEETKTEEPKVEVKTYSISDALAILAKVGLALPEDTTADNLVERIIVAGNAVVQSENKDGETGETKVNPDSKETPAPVTMSHAGAVPAFLKPMVVKDLTNRVGLLVNTGRISQKYADEVLKPNIVGLQLSMDAQGNLDLGKFGVQLETLEALPENPLLSDITARVPREDGGTLMSHEERLPKDYIGSPLTEEDADKIVDAQFEAAGRKK